MALNLLSKKVKIFERMLLVWLSQKVEILTRMALVLVILQGEIPKEQDCTVM